VGRRWHVAVLAGLAAMLAGVLSVVVGLLPGALPKSWQWAHNWVLLSVVTVGLLLATVALAVIQARWPTDKQTHKSLAEIADQLAVRVKTQWYHEADVRRLNDPYPLPVSWHAADTSLADSWKALVTLAASGHGWPAPSSPGIWAASPNDLAGEGRDLAQVLARVPTGRLVVLGAPGAGKTMLMVGLVLDLLTARMSGAPVPVLASLASWNPKVTDLNGWLATQLAIDYPMLTAPAPPGADGDTRIDALLRAGMIVPVLDGLDEIPDAVRGPAITRINDALRPGENLVLTCRTENYESSVRMRAAAVIELCPLDAAPVSRYLRDDAGGPIAAARWDPVIADLGTQAPVAQALTTPLMIGLARTIYNPRVGERAGNLRDPVELCSPTLADRRAVESQLLDAFIPAAYRPTPCRWPAQKAETWLAILALHLEHNVDGPDLAWWQLHQAACGDESDKAAFAAGAAAGTAAGTAVGLVLGVAVSPIVGIVAGLVAGLATCASMAMDLGLGSSSDDLSEGASVRPVREYAQGDRQQRPRGECGPAFTRSISRLHAFTRFCFAGLRSIALLRLCTGSFLTGLIANTSFFLSRCQSPCGECASACAGPWSSTLCG
jgi:hypothetical protein